MSPQAAKKVPELVEPFRFADQGLSVSGAIPLQRLPRLAEGLLGTDGEVAVDLEFGRDEQGRYQLRGRVDAVLSVRCQRCLEAMTVHLTPRLGLLLARSEDEAERLGPGEDALIVDDDLVSVPEIVEDELILAMPTFPRHPDSECHLQWQADARSTEAPEADGKTRSRSFRV